MPRSLQLSFTAIALAAIIYFIDIDELRQLLANADYVLLLLTLLVFLADRVLMAYKWTLLLRPHAIRMNILDAWSVYSMACLYGTFFPSTVGADALRLVDLKRRGEDAYAISASIIIERITGFIVGSSLGALALIYFSSKLNFQPSYSSWLMAMAGASISIALIVLLLRFVRRKRTNLLSGRWVDIFRERWKKLQSAHRIYATESAILIKFSVLTVMEQVLSLAMGYLLALALNVDVAMFDFMAALAMGLLLSRLPLTIDGLGVMEATVGGMLVWVGVPVTDSIAIVLVGRLMNILAFLPGTIVHSIRDTHTKPEQVKLK